MLNIKQRKKRVFEELKSVDDVIELLKDQFADKKLYIKYSVEQSEIQINEFLDDKRIMVIAGQEYQPEGDTIIIYGLLDKYFEIDLKIEETRGPGYYKCSIKSVRKAKIGRRDLRFKVLPDEAFATNFKVSKHTINVSGFKIPTTIKVVLDQFRSRNSGLSDIVKIDVFSKGDLILNLIRKTGKTLFVEDLSNPESYKAFSDDFLDLIEHLGDDLKMYIKRNVERGYKSIIISPIIYITEDEKSVPFGYIQIISKTENFDLEKVLEIKDITFKLIERIQDANTHMLPVHQQIVDISQGGVKIKITDENLKKYIARTRGFIFDIVFKLQAPITIYGEVKFTNTDEGGDLYIGVDFAGNSSRKNEMKRFYSVIKPMEIEYKNRLIKELKQKRKANS